MAVVRDEYLFRKSEIWSNATTLARNNIQVLFAMFL